MEIKLALRPKMHSRVSGKNVGVSGTWRFEWGRGCGLGFGFVLKSYLNSACRIARTPAPTQNANPPEAMPVPAESLTP